MGVYRKTNSPYFWFYFPLGLSGSHGKARRGIRCSSGMPTGGSPAIYRENLRRAEDEYTIRLARMAQDRLAKATTSPTVHPPKPLNMRDGGWCYIYFMQRGSMVKIGRAFNVAKRIEGIKTASYEPVFLLAVVGAHQNLEGEIHRRFKAHRVKREWFKLVPELVEFIDALNSGKNPVELLFGAPMPDVERRHASASV